MRFDSRKNIKPIVDKLISFSEELLKDPKNRLLGFNDLDMTSLNNMVNTVQAAVTPEQFEAIQFSAEQLAVVSKMSWWPEEKLFPMIDLCRILVLNQSACEYLLSKSVRIMILLRCIQSFGLIFFFLNFFWDF
jgi:hypothetical protein